MSTDVNPYAASPLSHAELHVPESRAAVAGGFAVIWAWERLRIIFNVVLFIEAGLFLIGGLAFQWHASRNEVLQYILAANVCFCIGPVAEAYLSLIRLRGLWLRWVLFFLGTAFSVLLTFLMLILVTFPGQN